MLGDWENYEKLLKGNEYQDLKEQIIRIDICHYDFPNNITLVLQGIGQLQAQPQFQGCGSFSAEAKIILQETFHDLKKYLRTFEKKENKSDLMKKWLVLSLLKTIKSHVKLFFSL